MLLLQVLPQFFSVPIVFLWQLFNSPISSVPFAMSWATDDDPIREFEAQADVENVQSSPFKYDMWEDTGNVSPDQAKLAWLTCTNQEGGRRG